MGIGNTRIKKSLIIFLKVIGWLTAGVFLLVILLALLIQIPSIQNRIVKKAVAFLENKIHTQVRLDRVSIGFPKQLVLEGLFLEDESHDTLLYTGKLSVNTDMWALTKKKIQLNDVQLENLHAKVRRSRDSTFNFDYIIKAFAGTNDSLNVAPSDTSNWVFDIHDIYLNNLHLFFSDSLEGNSIALKLTTLEVEIDEFDLTQAINVDRVLLSGVQSDVVQAGIPLPSVDTSQNSVKSSPLQVIVDEMDLENIHIRYEQIEAGQSLYLDLGKCRLEEADFNASLKKIVLDKFSLEKSFIMMHQTIASSPDSSEASSTSQQKMDWQVSLNELSLVDNSVQFYDFSKPILTRAFDVNHLWFQAFNLHASDIRMDSTGAGASVKELSFRERSGFSIQSMTGICKITDNSVDIKEFFLKTGHSIIHIDLHSNFESLASLSKTYPSAVVQGEIKSNVSWRDILFFQPMLPNRLPVTIPASASFVVNTRVDGSVDNLEIQTAYLKALKETTVLLSGKIRGLPDIAHTQFAIELEKFYTTHNDVASILPDTLLPDSIHIPAWVSINGNFSGTINNPSVETALLSELGSIYVKGTMMNVNSDSPGYDGHIELNQFQLGTLLKQPQEIGALDMEASVKGNGITLENIKASLKATVNSFVYKNYTYQNFRMNGVIDKYLYSGNAEFEDPNLNFKVEGDVNYNDKNVPQYKLVVDLKHVDFKALHLTERPLKARGTLKVKLNNANLKNLNGNLGIRNVAIYNGERLYRVDSLLFASVNQKGNTEININSDFADGKFKGNIDLASLPKTLKDHFRSYYTLHDSTQHNLTSAQNFSFYLQLKNTELLTDILFPELTTFEPGEIRGDFDSEKQDLDVSLNIKRITYSSMAGEDLTFKLISNKRTLRYDFTTGEVNISSINIPGLVFTGNVRKDSIITSLSIKDLSKKDKYIIGGVFQSEQQGYRFYFNPSQVMLNYKHWKVPSDNYLEFGKSNFLAHNMALSNGIERITLKTATVSDSALTVSFEQLDLKSIASMVSSKDTLLNGVLQGSVKLMPTKGKGAMEARMSIRNFAIRQKAWGNIEMVVQEKNRKEYAVDFSIKGEQNDVVVSGNYIATETNPGLDLKVSIEALNFSSLEPLTAGQAKEMKGNLTGNLSVMGPINQPAIIGNLHFKEVQFLSTYINTKLHLKDETISFTKSGISFEDFQVLDNNNNPLLLSGDVKTSSLKLVEFDLSLKAKNFQLLNTNEKDSKLFYGNLRINTDATIRGTSKLPVVNMKASLGSGSSFTYIMPQPDNGVLESEGIVRFVNKKVSDPFLKSLEKTPSETSTDTLFSGMDLTADIALTDNETFNIIIDPVSGDRLTVNGNANLLLSVTPTGHMQLSGRYELTDGSYNFNFRKLAKRSFEIRKGSSITWSGDPTDGILDITAIYRVETSPIDLIGNQSLGFTPEQLTLYKQRLPFLVYLMIQDKLLTPKISFQIDMPEQQRGALGGTVYASIQDINTREAERDKQVFALLILKRFVSDNPLQSQGDNGLESTARRSVSELLSEQLNRLSSNVKGVELNFDVKSTTDYSTGQGQNNTQVQLGLTKSLFDNRLVVKVTGNVNVEGDQPKQGQSTTSDYIGDLALEYKITEDGRFRVTGFRKSDYTMIDGELIETGTGVIYIKDYNTLRELFKANAKQEN